MIFRQPATDVKVNKLRPFSIAWLFPHADLARDPSNRLRRFQISKQLKGMPGLVAYCDNFFFYDKNENLREKLINYDIIVIFNVNEFDLNLILFLKEKGKIVIFDHSENIFGLGHEDSILENVTAVTCCSMALARNTHGYIQQKFNIDKPIFVIRDPLDNNDSLSHDRPPPLWNIALIMGMGANVQYVLPTLERYCKEAGYRIFILSESGFSFPKHQVEYWTPYNWMEHAAKCSVALCFHSIAQFPAKGNVKVTAPMSLGLPVIAVPMESYSEAITDGYDGFIAQNDPDWVDGLIKLKNPGLRNIMGIRARQSAINNYSTAKITLDYLSMIGFLQE